MTYIRLIKGLAGLFFLFGCAQTTTPEPTGDPGRPRSNEHYDRRVENDPDRDDVIRNNKRRYRGDPCEDEDRDHDCKEQCKEMYSGRRYRDECEEFSPAHVEALHEVWEILESPRGDDLEGINLDDLNTYLNVTIESFEKLVGKYSKSEAKSMLAWIVSEGDITEKIIKQEDEYSILKDLLKKIDANYTGDDIYKPFVSTNIDDGNNLIELAIENSNEAVEWFHDYIQEDYDHCENQNDADDKLKCFTVFCKMGDKVKDDLIEEWLRIDVMDSYIDEVLEDKINCDEWNPSTRRPNSDDGKGIIKNSEGDGEEGSCGGPANSDAYEDPNDLDYSGSDDTWVKVLCEGLTT